MSLKINTSVQCNYLPNMVNKTTNTNMNSPQVTMPSEKVIFSINKWQVSEKFLEKSPTMHHVIVQTKAKKVQKKDAAAQTGDYRNGKKIEAKVGKEENWSIIKRAVKWPNRIPIYQKVQNSKRKEEIRILDRKLHGELQRMKRERLAKEKKETYEKKGLKIKHVQSVNGLKEQVENHNLKAYRKQQMICYRALRDQNNTLEKKIKNTDDRMENLQQAFQLEYAQIMKEYEEKDKVIEDLKNQLRLLKQSEEEF